MGGYVLFFNVQYEAWTFLLNVVLEIQKSNECSSFIKILMPLANLAIIF